MIDLDFRVEDCRIAPRSATPLSLFKLRLTSAAPIEHVMLQAQIRIEAAQREYSRREQERLVELFGPPAEWSRSLRGLLWTTASVAVTGFAGECTVELPVPCSYDFEIAATKFLAGVEQSEVPLLFLFSGSIFFRDDDGELQIVQVAHHKEAAYRLPATLWQALMAQHYPDGVWLRLDRDVFDEFRAYQRRGGFAGTGQALRALLAREIAGAAR